MPERPHHNWRDLQAWRELGFRFSTTSNEAVKLWDGALTQYVAWYDDDGLGGINKTMKDMLTTHPDFVMGKVMSVGMDLMSVSRNIRTDPTFQPEIDDLVKLRPSCNPWEQKHIDAVNLWSKGRAHDAALVWEDILTDNPLDMLALKLSHDHYNAFGEHERMRDSSGRVFSHWNETIPLYGYLHGLHSFGLVETNMLAEAEKVAKKGLEMNPLDAWSTHSLAHIYENPARAKEGLAFLKGTEKNWSQSDWLACHNYWHVGLYHVELNQQDEALALFDEELATRLKGGEVINVVDASALLLRLEFEGVNVGRERWECINEMARQHEDEHVTVFNDIHLLMSYLGMKKPEVTERLMKSIKNYIENYGDVEDMGKVSKEVGWSLYNALIAYDSGEFDKAVDYLLPIRYKIVHIGGSVAQRDVFHLLLVNAALRSKSHQKLCQNLIFERQNRSKSQLNDRLMARWNAIHVSNGH